MKRNVKISVITVSYNSAKTIRKTIESVLGQNYDALEYIIIDGGSTDETVDILEEYGSGISYWVSEKDQGIYDAMNKGIKKCNGEIVAFLNSDDWYENNILEIVARYYEETCGDILYGNYFWIGDGEKRLMETEDGITNAIHYEWPFCHQAMFFKRKLYDEIGLFDLSYRISADYEWVLRAYIKGSKFVHIPTPICTFIAGGYSQIYAKEGADEVKQLCTSLLPTEHEEEYLGRINERYRRTLYNTVVREVRSGIDLDDEVVLTKMYRIIFREYKKVCIFGSGSIGTRCISFFSRLEDHELCVMDNNDKLWGSTVEGRKVSRPYLLPDKDSFVIIAVKYGTDEIFNQLLDLGYDKDRIILYTEINKLILDNWFNA